MSCFSFAFEITLPTPGQLLGWQALGFLEESGLLTSEAHKHHSKGFENLLGSSTPRPPTPRPIQSESQCWGLDSRQWVEKQRFRGASRRRTMCDFALPRPNTMMALCRLQDSSGHSSVQLGRLISAKPVPQSVHTHSVSCLPGWKSTCLFPLLTILRW